MKHNVKLFFRDQKILDLGLKLSFDQICEYSIEGCVELHTCRVDEVNEAAASVVSSGCCLL